MIKIAGVRFRGSGKVYYFDPGDFTPPAGTHVIVDTARGLEYGVTCGPVREMEEDKVPQPLRPILRVADEADEERIATNRRREKEAMAICREKIRSRGLEMKLIDAEYTFDNNKILFYFTADGRIDFRELVKDLAGVFRTRIELRQIGVRDETKILGGIGICGRPLCCHTYLTDFVPVSIKMAKEQNLSLNPTKISGTCGRLMCCLKNEEDTYEYLNSKLPSVGEMVTTPTGAVGKVSSVNVLRQRVKIVIEENDEKEIHEYDAQELKFHSGKGKDHSGKKHGNKESRDSQDGRERKDGSEDREKREPSESGEKREGSGNRGKKDGFEGRERRDSSENREKKDGSGSREKRERRENRDNKDKGRSAGPNAAEPAKDSPVKDGNEFRETAGDAQGQAENAGAEEKKERRRRYRPKRGKRSEEREGEKH